MVDREKYYLAGFVMGYEKASCNQIGCAIGGRAYFAPDGENGTIYASGYKKGLEDAAYMVQKLVDSDENDLRDVEDVAAELSEVAKRFLEEKKPSRYSYKWTACDDSDDCLICTDKRCIHHPDYQPEEPNPVYLDTSVTDLCEAAKQVMASAIGMIKGSDAASQIPFLEHLIEEADALETRSVREQVDGYYGTK